MPINLRSVAAGSLLAPLLFAATLPAQDYERPRSQRGPDGFLFRAPTATLALRLGFDVRRANSNIYDMVTEELTLKRSDFNALSLGADLGFRVAGPVDLVFSAAYARSDIDSEFRDWVDQDDLPITQTTTLYTVPLTVAARWYLTPRGRQIGRFVWIPGRVMPYVGAGGGAVRYAFEQAGSFVDFTDQSIFDDVLRSDGWTPVGLVMAGVDYTVAPRIGLNADARYQWANGDLRRDFIEFTDGIDLSGLQVSLGLQFRL